MAIPGFDDIRLPALRAAARRPMPLTEMIEEMSNHFGLTDDERAEMMPSGRNTRMCDRTSWATKDLVDAGLLHRPARGVLAITGAGRQALDTAPLVIDKAFLNNIETYREYLDRIRTRDRETTERNRLLTDRNVIRDKGGKELTPTEAIRTAHAEITDALAQELLERIQSSPPRFFEELIVDLLVRMGYGAGGDTARAIGQAGDDGVDGVINLDTLGVDQVYFQAKRYQTGSAVSAGALRDFFGALAMKDVTKGIFVTTSHFTPSARDTADKLSKRIVLIDGPTLARLMIRHSVGCRVTDTFPVSTIDESYFE